MREPTDEEIEEVVETLGLGSAEQLARALIILKEAVETSLPPNRRGHHIGVALNVARKTLGR